MTTELHAAGPLPEAAPEGEHRPGPLKRADHVGRTLAWGRDWWTRRQERRAAERVAAAAGHVEMGPLSQGEIDTDGSVTPRSPVARPSRHRKSWREKRWERRRRRRFTEEVLGWVLVPVILISGFWAVKAGLNAMGTNFTTLVQGVKTALSASGKM